VRVGIEKWVADILATHDMSMTINVINDGHHWQWVNYMLTFLERILFSFLQQMAKLLCWIFLQAFTLLILCWSASELGTACKHCFCNQEFEITIEVAFFNKWIELTNRYGPSSTKMLSKYTKHMKNTQSIWNETTWSNNYNIVVNLLVGGPVVRVWDQGICSPCCC
jgi:hypothetical protein